MEKYCDGQCRYYITPQGCCSTVQMQDQSLNRHLLTVVTTLGLEQQRKEWRTQSSRLREMESRHTIVCRAAQEAGAPHREYINRKKENAIFTPM